MKTVKFDSKVSWAVAVACGCMNLLILIPMKVSGLFFVEILDRYHVGRNLAGYPAFTLSLIRCSGGPLVGYFAEIFGMNDVMILGSILAAMGISVCFFAEDIAVVIASLGLIHGVGVAFLNTFLPMIVKIHFKKHITLAFGITQAGACVGAFFTPPLLLWIFRNYGTSGGFLIIGAVVLNSLPIVMILNILSPDSVSRKSNVSKKVKKLRTAEQTERGTTTSVTSFEDRDNNMTYNDENKREKDVKMKDENIASDLPNNPENKAKADLVQSWRMYDQAEVEQRTSGPFSALKVKKMDSEKVGMEFVLDEYGIISEIKPKTITQEKENGEAIDRNVNEFQKHLRKDPVPLSDIRTKLMKNSCEENLQHSVDHTYSKNKYKSKAEISNKDILKHKIKNTKDCDLSKDADGGTTPCTPVSNASVSRYSALPATTQLLSMTETGEILPPTIHASSSECLETMLPSFQEINHKEELKTDKQPTTRATNANKSLKIFLDLTYWIVMTTQSLHMYVLIMFWTTMIDFSRDKNIDRSVEVYLLMTLPIAEIIGRLGLGWITDSNYLTRINFCILFFTVMGFSCSLMASARSFYVVMTSIFIFGVVSSGLIAVFPMVIFEFFDTAKHTMGQASKYCLFGPLSFLNGPLIGYFRGTLGSYAWLYHTMAIVSVVCGALSALIPLFARMRDDKKKEKLENYAYHLRR